MLTENRHGKMLHLSGTVPHTQYTLQTGNFVQSRNVTVIIMLSKASYPALLFSNYALLILTYFYVLDLL